MDQGHPLYVDIQAYKNQIDELLKHHPGKYVIFHDGQFHNAYDTFNTAAKEAINEFGQGPYLIRMVGTSENYRMPASVAFRPIYADN